MSFYRPPPLEQQVARFLRRRKYQLVRHLKKDKVYETEKNGRSFVFKLVTPNEFIAHRDVLAKLDVAFRRLVIPSLLDAGHARFLGRGVSAWVITEWQEGQDFGSRWDERIPHIAGGRAIPLETHDLVLQLIEDLRRIDGAILRASAIKNETQKSLQASFDKQLLWARREGHLDECHETKARQILKPFLDTVDIGRIHLSNGDFQFRNFTERTDGKVALLDWDSAKASTFETEHCVAYQWLLMWNNPRWQGRFLNGARVRFALRPERFRAVLLVDALNQAFFWRRCSDLLRIQVNYVSRVLSDAYFEKELWSAE